MKKLILLSILIIANAYEFLWIYTDINCSKLINSLKIDYQNAYHKEIKILKAPFSILIKKLQLQKKADLFITDNLRNVKKHPKIFNKYYNKIGIKKLALFFKKNKNYTFDDVINTPLKIGIVERCSICNDFKEAVSNYAGNKKLIEIKFFKIKQKYKNSSNCANAILENKIDVCIDWMGTDYWNIFNKQFGHSLIKENLYHIQYVYVVSTSFSHKNNLKNEFINFAKKRFERLGKKKVKTMNYLFPDLQLWQ